jgi:hypothetical protein
LTEPPAISDIPMFDGQIAPLRVHAVQRIDRWSARRKQRLAAILG